MQLLTVCIAGAGPRGLVVLERLCAGERKSPAHEAITVHVVEPYEPGAGRVWRTRQPRRLLMNTVASQVTVHTDHSVLMDGPVEPGPSLHEWAAALTAHPDPEVLAEASRLGPDDYSSRAFYGAYLTAAYRTVVEHAPAHVTVVHHRTRAVALSGGDGPQRVTLADGTRLTGVDAVVLALGHLPAELTADERGLAKAAAAHGLTYVPPANPADADLSRIGPGETVFVRGLGLNFFDVLALLTEERGGVFEADGGELRYRPSGREPRIVAGSRRGVPYHARGENQKGPHGRHEPRLLTLDAVARLHRRAEEGERVHFRTDLWPLIAKEVEGVYYGGLLAARGRQREPFVGQFLAARGHGEEARLLAAAGIAPADRWDWERLQRPYPQAALSGPAAWREWLCGHLAADVREARAGNVGSPLKAALDVLRDLRNEIRSAVDHGRLEGNSYRDDLQAWYTPLNAFLSIGPPASRTAQLLALIAAGVVDVIGPRPQLAVSEGGFTVTSTAVPGSGARATAVVEARLPEPDLPRTADPLLRDLLRRGQAARHRIPGTCGTAYETRGLAVTERPYRLLSAAGRPHPRRFAYGVPTESVHWVTAAGIRPGVNSVTLADADAIARAVLALPAGEAVLAPQAGEAVRAPQIGKHPTGLQNSPVDQKSVEVNA